MKRKLNKKRLLLLITLLILIITFIISLVKIIGYVSDTLENKEVVNKIETSISTNEEDVYIIDFNTLKNINSDTVGYIEVPNTNISYIVVKGTDNEFYLTHNFEKKWNVSGWVFADYHNTFDGSDKNIVIYGHNSKNGMMFGTLKNVLNTSWQENIDNRVITLITEDNTYYYDIFSTYTIIPEDYYIKTVFSDNEFEEFINTVKNRSIYDYNIEVTPNDKVLTLSSCIGDGKKRVVLHAKRRE